MAFSEVSTLAGVTQDTVEKWKEYKKNSGWSDVTINNSLKDLQAIYNRAAKLSLYTGPNPFKRAERLRLDKKMPGFHTEEELVRLLECARAHDIEIEWVVLLGGWAGLRKNELVNARWEWFEFDSEQPVIRVQSSEDFKLKDHEERTIPMSERVRRALAPHRRESGYLFPGDMSNSRYRFDPRRGLEACLRSAGLTTEKPYQRLRMSFGSVLVQNGVSIFKVSKWLGHSSVTVTERHYVGIQAYDPEINVF